jgi:NAD(P)-dependent dehydrogenase (short-subunit alcohol dehydrogenase family)/acyl carrier protein
MQQVWAAERLRPEKTTILGLTKVIPQECQNISCACIDVDGGDSDCWRDGSAIEALVRELEIGPMGEFVAFRGGQRWIQHFEPLSLPKLDGQPRILRPGGVYLITGGLGGVTFIMAALLAKTMKPRLVLTGRTPLPDRSEWDRWLEARGPADPVSRKIAKVRTLEGMGATVVVEAVDAGDTEGMTRVVQEAEKRFGALHGVIHGAGIVGGSTFRPLHQLGHAAHWEQFHPKVAGLLALERALAGHKLDFCWLTSSLSSVLGGFGYSAYAAANSFMDAYTRYHNQHGETPWLSVNWDEWRLSSDGADAASALHAYAMLPQEGAEAFRRIFSLRGAPQVVVSSGDLQYRIDQWVKLDALKAARESHKQSSAARRHARPNLQSAYLAPGSDDERRIAAIWEELLGIEKVGICDNFFELGGHSLLAIQLVSRIRADLKAEIAVASLFEGPTVQSLARLMAKPDSPEAFEGASERGARRREERLKRQSKEKEETIA